MFRIVWCLGGIFFAGTALADVDLRIHYLRKDVEAPPTLSNLDSPPDNLGLAGARVGLADNQTTGSFLGQRYELTYTAIAPDDDLREAANAALADTQLLVIDAPPDDLLAVADLDKAAGAVIFNVAAPEARLRSEDCRGNILHTLPSNAMRTDALAQFLVRKRWDDLALVAGVHPADVAFADTLRNSTAKFGLDIDTEKTWAFDADMRRNAAQEVPLFTQDLGDYDALLIADETGDFGRYVLYNTWQARPVTGSEGLTAVTWAPVVEQWGAAQLQSRFADFAGRGMQSKDYAAWAAIRSIGEAVTRTKSADAATLREYLISDEFELAGFKGRPMNYRSWNGQLRQPIPIVHPRALVAMAPLEGFLHQRTELDTLGLDQPESKCQAFTE
ncbi:ABC transporter substrate-binding protein [Hoeflea sp. TYP-13]|uniref:ABC transporter substrate-binding protein n=1 Tax=Hoeflea sp. TYP-13 TaxID=3230023 RepID=UPI0034C6D5D0